MGVSERKFAHGHALLVYATLRELEAHGILKEHLSLDTVDTFPTSCFENILTYLCSVDNESYSSAYGKHDC